jgi:sugar phosphate isomerase/epimerase
MFRRTFLGSTAAGGLGAGWAAGAAVTGATPNAPGQFKLGIASYSFRKFSRDQAIAMTKQLGIDTISIKDFHMAWKGTTAEQRRADSDAFRKAGINVVSGGVMRMTKEEEVVTYFQYAKDAGLPLMIIMPDEKLVPVVEKMVKQHDIPVAIHNHGPEDKNFPSCMNILKAIQGTDPRVGICCDVGHEIRTGSNLLEVVKACGKRLHDVHTKDLTDFSTPKSQVAVGEGKIPIAGLFKLLKKMNYAGNVNLEYEIFADDPMPGMRASFAHMRGILAGMGV